MTWRLKVCAGLRFRVRVGLTGDHHDDAAAGVCSLTAVRVPGLASATETSRSI